MKLKNKLLPLVGVATACAAVAPIALTSCTNDSIAGKDLTKWFTPTITRHDADVVSLETAIGWYFGTESEGWKTDTTNIIQDMQWSTSMMLNIANYSTGSKTTEKQAIEILTPESESSYTPSGAEVDVDLDYNYYNVQLSGLTFGTTYDPAKTTQLPTLSYTLNYEYEYNASADVNLSKGSQTGTTECTWHYKGTYTVKDLPVTLTYQDLFFESDDDRFFVVSPYVSLIRYQYDQDYKTGGTTYHTDFSINDSYSYDGEVTTKNKSLVNTQTQSGSSEISYGFVSRDDKQFATLKTYLNNCPIYFGSYYLYSVGCDDWE